MQPPGKKFFDYLQLCAIVIMYEYAPKFRFIEQFIERKCRGRPLDVPFYWDFAMWFRGVEGAAPYKCDFKQNDKFEFAAKGIIEA